MGVTLSEVGTGPDGHGQLVSWSGDVTDGQQEIANASAYPLLRLAVQGTVGLPAPTEHAHLVTGSLNARSFPSWFKPSSANVGPFSAVCWMFGRRLQAQLGVPVGLIQNAVGGSAVERWASKEAMSQCDQTRASRMAVCMPGAPDTPDPTRGNSSLYNGMIAPWAKMAMRGAVWCECHALVQTVYQSASCSDRVLLALLQIKESLMLRAATDGLTSAASTARCPRSIAQTTMLASFRECDNARSLVRQPGCARSDPVWLSTER
jgi:hypothetical protein